MISHVNVGTNDFARAFSFYEAVFDALGLVLRFRGEEGHWVAWNGAAPVRGQWPFDANPAANGNGHATAMHAGGSDEGAPGPRPEYHANYYGAAGD